MIETSGKETHDVPRQLAGIAHAAGGDQFVKTVVSSVFHVVQAFVQFLDRHGSHRQPAEQDAAANQQDSQQAQQAPEDKFQDALHFREYTNC